MLFLHWHKFRNKIKRTSILRSVYVIIIYLTTNFFTRNTVKTKHVVIIVYINTHIKMTDKFIFLQYNVFGGLKQNMELI